MARLKVSFSSVKISSSDIFQSFLGRGLLTPVKATMLKKHYVLGVGGTGDSQRDSHESIRASHSQLKPLCFYSASGRFARIP